MALSVFTPCRSSRMGGLPLKTPHPLLRTIMRFICLCVLCLGAGAGCSYFSDENAEDETRKWDAERTYFAAKDRMDSGYYKGAIEYYRALRQRFPFGGFAQQAQLDIAYCYYKSDEPEAGMAAIDRFLKLYPTHPHTDYAYYLRGIISFNIGKGLTQRYLPTDLSQRDPGPALDAFNDFAELVRRFPDSQYVPDAKQRMLYLRNLLAQHEVNVANFYMRREAYIAAANRARLVVEQYQQTPAVPEALVLMAKCYRILEMDALADDALRVLRVNYPNHPGLREVERTIVK